MGRLILLVVIGLVVLGVVVIVVANTRSGIKRKDWRVLRQQAKDDRKALLDIRREASLYPDNPLSGVIIQTIDNHLNREIEQ